MAARLAAMGNDKYADLTRKSGGRAVWTGKIRIDEKSLSIPATWSKPRTPRPERGREDAQPDASQRPRSRGARANSPATAPPCWCQRSGTPWPAAHLVDEIEQLPLSQRGFGVKCDGHEPSVLLYELCLFPQRGDDEGSPVDSGLELDAWAKAQLTPKLRRHDDTSCPVYCHAHGIRLPRSNRNLNGRDPSTAVRCPAAAFASAGGGEISWTIAMQSSDGVNRVWA